MVEHPERIMAPQRKNAMYFFILVTVKDLKFLDFINAILINNVQTSNKKEH
jgi:hypothetical protein